MYEFTLPLLEEIAILKEESRLPKNFKKSNIFSSISKFKPVHPFLYKLCVKEPFKDVRLQHQYKTFVILNILFKRTSSPVAPYDLKKENLYFTNL